ncbi:NUDIX hydrolase [Thioalkalicoccus limnaeus]|uniref:GDP-mannose pyrophosphatase n=1 Tax=Thioalkalicoccus limnaeus TaxID=120681 RepID=A0ABV4BB96_9GAMM
MDQAETENRRSVFRGRVVDVGVETVRLPNGQSVSLEIIRHPGGAAVVALDGEQRVCLLRQYRHAAGGWLWELPAGQIDPGERPRATAQRELAEEAGLVARDWTELGPVHSSPGVFTEIIHLYLARDLRELPVAHGADEVIEVHWYPFAEVLEWCVTSVITDAKTAIGLMRAAARVGIGYR